MSSQPGRRQTPSQRRQTLGQTVVKPTAGNEQTHVRLRRLTALPPPVDMILYSTCPGTRAPTGVPPSAAETTVFILSERDRSSITLPMAASVSSVPQCSSSSTPEHAAFVAALADLHRETSRAALHPLLESVLAILERSSDACISFRRATASEQVHPDPMTAISKAIEAMVEARECVATFAAAVADAGHSQASIAAASASQFFEVTKKVVRARGCFGRVVAALLEEEDASYVREGGRPSRLAALYDELWGAQAALTRAQAWTSGRVAGKVRALRKLAVEAVAAEKRQVTVELGKALHASQETCHRMAQEQQHLHERAGRLEAHVRQLRERLGRSTLERRLPSPSPAPLTNESPLQWEWRLKLQKAVHNVQTMTHDASRFLTDSLGTVTEAELFRRIPGLDRRWAQRFRDDVVRSCTM